MEGGGNTATLLLTVSTELDPLDESLVRLALDALGDRGLGEEGDDGHSGVTSATGCQGVDVGVDSV